MSVRQEAQESFFHWTDFYWIRQVNNWLLLYTLVEHRHYLNLERVQPPATPPELLARVPRAALTAE